MTKYAYYDSTILANDQVIGWIDSDIEKNMPPSADLLEVTDEQWEARTSDVFYVVGGVLTGSKNILLIMQAVQASALSKSCEQQIVSGFTSSALGSVNIYASAEVDQRNIVQSAQSIKGGLLSCKNTAGLWARQAHTQAQAQQALEDFVTARDDARLKLQTDQAQIAASTTVTAVQAIIWEGEGG